MFTSFDEKKICSSERTIGMAYCDGCTSALGRTSGTVTVTVEGPFINWRLMGPCSVFLFFFFFDFSLFLFSAVIQLFN